MEPTTSVNGTAISAPEDCDTCVSGGEWMLAIFGLVTAGLLIYMAVDVITGSRVSSLLTGQVITGELADS